MPLEWSRAVRGPVAKACPGGQPQPPSIVLHWTPGNARGFPEATTRKLDLARAFDLPDTTSITIVTSAPDNLKSKGFRSIRLHATSDADPADILPARPSGIRYTTVRYPSRIIRSLCDLKTSRRVISSSSAVLGKANRCRAKPKRYPDLRPR